MGVGVLRGELDEPVKNGNPLGEAEPETGMKAGRRNTGSSLGVATGDWKKQNLLI